MSATRIGITGLGMHVPAKVLTNADLEKMVETTDEWIQSRTGIKERRVAEIGTTTSDLAYGAATEALRQANLDPKDVELLIVATTTPDMLFPATSCLVQQRLGAKSAVCFDLSAACSGSVFAIITAQQYLLTGRYKNALVIGAEVLSSFIDWTDRSTCVLFGDGTEIFKLAVRRMADSAKRVVAEAGLAPEHVECFIPHQANIRIIEAVAKFADLPLEKVYMNLQRYGNTSAASNLMALYEAVKEGVIKRDDHVVMVAFGAGLTWGSLLLQW